jgi:hypothetical protein
MAFWRLDRRVLWRNSNSIRSSFREERGGLRASKERLDSAPPTREGRPESRLGRLGGPLGDLGDCRAAPCADQPPATGGDAVSCQEAHGGLGRLCVRFALAASSALKARDGVVMRTKFDPREDWKSKLKFRLR